MAATGVTFKDFVGTGASSGGIIGVIDSIVIPLIFSLIFLMFIWGAARYFIIQGTDESARAKGRQLMLWGIFGIVALVALWGIVNLLLSTLGVAAGRPA